MADRRRRTGASQDSDEEEEEDEEESDLSPGRGPEKAAAIPARAAESECESEGVPERDGVVLSGYESADDNYSHYSEDEKEEEEGSCSVTDDEAAEEGSSVPRAVTGVVAGEKIVSTPADKRPERPHRVRKPSHASQEAQEDDAPPTGAGGKNSKRDEEEEDQKNPAFVPRKGLFFEHDIRGGNNKEDARAKVHNRKLWRDAGRWEHDRFREDEQAPKSREELVALYGYDIRSGAHADDARPLRRPRYRSPSDRWSRESPPVNRGPYQAPKREPIERPTRLRDEDRDTERRPAPRRPGPTTAGPAALPGRPRAYVEQRAYTEPRAYVEPRARAYTQGDSSRDQPPGTPAARDGTRSSPQRHQQRHQQHNGNTEEEGEKQAEILSSGTEAEVGARGALAAAAAATVAPGTGDAPFAVDLAQDKAPERKSYSRVRRLRNKPTELPGQASTTDPVSPVPLAALAPSTVPLVALPETQTATALPHQHNPQQLQHQQPLAPPLKPLGERTRPIAALLPQPLWDVPVLEPSPVGRLEHGMAQISLGQAWNPGAQPHYLPTQREHRGGATHLPVNSVPPPFNRIEDLGGQAGRAKRYSSQRSRPVPEPHPTPPMHIPLIEGSYYDPSELTHTAYQAPLYGHGGDSPAAIPPQGMMVQPDLNLPHPGLHPHQSPTHMYAPPVSMATGQPPPPAQMLGYFPSNIMYPGAALPNPGYTYTPAPIPPPPPPPAHIFPPPQAQSQVYGGVTYYNTAQQQAQPKPSPPRRPSQPVSVKPPPEEGQAERKE
ncbi:protein CASC3 isoform X3 [Lampetra fluviatilis]